MLGLCEVCAPEEQAAINHPDQYSAALALISFATLIPANIIVRPRPTQKNAPRPAMDWAAFRDLPYMLMMAGTSQLIHSFMALITYSRHRTVLLLLGTVLWILLRESSFRRLSIKRIHVHIF